MNIAEIKELMKNERGKIIIVENEEPTLVILSYKEYRNGGDVPARQVVRQEDAQDGEDRRTLLASSRAEESSEGLTIDDLPL